jgi:hypothetical protein
VFFLLLLALVGLAELASPSELRVPQDYGTIGEAIAAAGPGDVILIAPGLYRENLTIGKREIAIQGDSAERPGSVLTNLVITGNEGKGYSSCGRVKEPHYRGRLHREPRSPANRIRGIARNRLELRENLVTANRGCGLRADEASADPSILFGGSNAIFGNGQDLCGAAQARRDLLDQTPPSAPRNLTISPADWTNQGRFVIDWENPEDIAGISAYWFKVGLLPAHPRTAHGGRSRRSPWSSRTRRKGNSQCSSGSRTGWATKITGTPPKW